jgi:general secretion pathway protein D
MQWTIQNDFTIKGIKPFKNGIHIEGPLKLDTPITSPTFSFTAVDAANNTKLLLQALASEGRAKVLAAPHILVSDNREARIQVGSQVPLATSTSATPIVGTETTTTLSSYTTIQYKDIGIILKVKPQVNDSGLVSLEISQEISSVGASAKIAGQDFSSIDKTETSTNLVAQDGETIIIGGLIREDVNKSRSGIPFLSRIPILGYLFGNTIDETTRTELIILLTPHVMRNQKEAGNVTTDYINRYQGTTKDKAINPFIKEKGQKEKSGGDN